MSHKNFTPRTIIVGEEPIGFAVHANAAKHDAFHNVAVYRGLPNSLATYARSQVRRVNAGKSIGVPAYTANIPGSSRRADAAQKRLADWTPNFLGMPVDGPEVSGDPAYAQD